VSVPYTCTPRRKLIICSPSYDVDYPVDCDDEYWEPADPAMAFKQPEGKPSLVSYTIAYLKLMEILGMAQDTIVSLTLLFHSPSRR
jgi:hypothetical protein